VPIVFDPHEATTFQSGFGGGLQAACSRFDQDQICTETTPKTADFVADHGAGT
jgi:hypothetical protein